MANRRSMAYGTPSGLIKLAPVPIVSLRTPTTGDVGYPVGSLWIDTTLSQVFCLTGYINGQAQWLNPGGTSAPDIEFITGNVGGAVGPDPVAFTLNLLGSGAMTVTGNPGTNTQTISVATASEAVPGVVELATAVETIAGVSNSLAVHPAGLDSKLGTQALNGIVLGGGGAGSALGITATPQDGELIIGRTAGAPVVSVPANGTNITWTPGAGTLQADLTGQVVVANGGTGVNTLTSGAILIGQGVAPVITLGPLADGELLIGSTGLDPIPATLTAGTGISIANAAGSITISASGSFVGSGQTIGAVTADLITVNLGATPSTYSFDAVVSGFELAGLNGCSYKIFASAKTNGAGSAPIGVPNQIVMEDAALVAADATFTGAANTAILRVTGVAGLTIDWDATLTITIGS